MLSTFWAQASRLSRWLVTCSSEWQVAQVFVNSVRPGPSGKPCAKTAVGDMRKAASNAAAAVLCGLVRRRSCADNVSASAPKTSSDDVLMRRFERRRQSRYMH